VFFGRAFSDFFADRHGAFSDVERNFAASSRAFNVSAVFTRADVRRRVCGFPGLVAVPGDREGAFFRQHDEFRFRFRSAGRLDRRPPAGNAAHQTFGASGTLLYLPRPGRRLYRTGCLFVEMLL
jgi:hypothetical protein